MTKLDAITWLGSAGLRLDAGNQRIYVDPWLGSAAFPETERDIDRIDALLITHAHDDHAGSAAELSVRLAAPVYAQTEVSAWLVAQGAIPALPLGMNQGGTVTVCGLDVTMVPAVHTSSSGGVAVGSASGFVIEADGACVYVAGDTDVFVGMGLIAELYAPTHAVLPVGGVMTMGPRQAVKAAELLGWPAILPYHWGSPLLPGNPSAFRDLMPEQYRDRVIDVAPGQRIPIAGI